jgi:hypothetical protein
MNPVMPKNVKGNKLQMETGKWYHAHFDVKGLLSKGKAEMKKMAKSAKNPDGTYGMTGDQLRDTLMNELLKGHELIPFGECDNFDYKDKGCMGHTKNEQM